MNKKITILLVIIVLAISGSVFWNMFGADKKNIVNEDSGVVSDSGKSKRTPGEVPKKMQKEVASNEMLRNMADTDIKDIESDLNLISDSDFNADNLSDQNVGL